MDQQVLRILIYFSSTMTKKAHSFFFLKIPFQLLMDQQVLRNMDKVSCSVLQQVVFGGSFVHTLDQQFYNLPPDAPTDTLRCTCLVYRHTDGHLRCACPSVCHVTRHLCWIPHMYSSKHSDIHGKFRVTYKRQ